MTKAPTVDELCRWLDRAAARQRQRAARHDRMFRVNSYTGSVHEFDPDLETAADLGIETPI